MVKLGSLISSKYTPGQLIEIVRTMESLSYSSVWHPDEKFYRDCYVGLTIMALNTQRLRLGVAVTDPFSRHPIMTATAIASLAEIAPKRVWLGMGAGGRGFKAMNITGGRPAVAIREAVSVIRRLLNGEAVDYHGEIISLNERSLDFMPPPGIKVMIATGFGKLIKQLAGEIADTIMLANVTSKRTILEGIEQVNIGASRGNRKLEEIELISRIDVSVHEDERIARDAVAPTILSALRASYPSLDYLKSIPNITLSDDLIRVLEKKDYQSRMYYAKPENCSHLIPMELFNHLAVAGTPDQVKNKLSELKSLGIFNEITVCPVVGRDQTIVEVIQRINEMF